MPTDVIDHAARHDAKPAGFLMVDGELMAYWTPDGRSIAEIWREALTANLSDKMAVNDDDDIPF